jgi:hypothetical protein
MLRIIGRNITSWTKYIRVDSEKKKLGRWKINDKINKKVDLANVDNCGDRVCGDLKNFKDNRHILKTFDARWNGDMNKQEFKILTDSYKNNIDSNDNSLYHESLYKKENNYSKHSIQSIVDDYNKRWKKNITVEEYYKNFK